MTLGTFSIKYLYVIVLFRLTYTDNLFRNSSHKSVVQAFPPHKCIAKLLQNDPKLTFDFLRKGQFCSPSPLAFVSGKAWTIDFSETIED